MREEGPVSTTLDDRAQRDSWHDDRDDHLNGSPEDEPKEARVLATGLQ